MTIRIKRVYDAPADDDGERILVDRLWPRGLSKQAAALSDWMKDVAPSTDLRKWFHGPSGEWSEFQKRYLAELADNPHLEALRQRIAAGTVTLLYGTHDTEHNHAQLLAAFIRDRREAGRK